MDKEDQVRLISDSVYRINPQLPSEIEMIILSVPPMTFVIPEEAIKLGICKDEKSFKEDIKTFAVEMRVIYTTVKHKSFTRGRDFCNNNSHQDDAYRSALDRMIAHGILNISTDEIEHEVSLAEDEEVKCTDDPMLKRLAACACFFIAGMVIIAFIVYFFIVYEVNKQTS